MLNSYRKHDAVLVVCQNYDTQVIEVAGINDKAKRLTGYSDEDTVGKPLANIISGDLIELIEEYVDFKDRNHDLGDVLAKVRDLKIRDTSDRILEFRLRIVRCEAVEGNPVFHLVLHDEELDRENEAFKKVLHENFKGHEVIEERTGLPDRQSLLKDMELVQHHQQKKVFSACFAVMEVDGMDVIRHQYGEDGCYEVVGYVGRLCKQRLRREDEVGVLSSRALGLILMQITPESSRIVLNRLRWSISSMPMIMNNGNRLDLTVSVAFHIVREARPEAIAERCEQALREIRARGGNLIQEVQL